MEHFCPRILASTHLPEADLPGHDLSGNNGRRFRSNRGRIEQRRQRRTTSLGGTTVASVASPLEAMQGNPAALSELTGRTLDVSVAAFLLSNTRSVPAWATRRDDTALTWLTRYNFQPRLKWRRVPCGG